VNSYGGYRFGYCERTAEVINANAARMRKREKEIFSVL